MSTRLPPQLLHLSDCNRHDQIKPHTKNKQAETETKPPCSTATSSTQNGMEGRGAVVLPARSETPRSPQLSWQIPVWSAQWKEIKQHISASLQLLGQSFWYSCSAEYRWESWVSRFLFFFSAFIPPTHQRQRSACVTCDIMNITTECMASIISSHDAAAVLKLWFTLPALCTIYQRGGGLDEGWWD